MGGMKVVEGDFFREQVRAWRPAEESRDFRVVNFPPRPGDLDFNRAAPALDPGCCLHRDQWRLVLRQVAQAIDLQVSEGYAELEPLRRAIPLLDGIIRRAPGLERSAAARRLCPVFSALERSRGMLSAYDRWEQALSQPVADAKIRSFSAAVDHLSRACESVLRYLLSRKAAQLTAARTRLEDGAATLLAAGIETA